MGHKLICRQPVEARVPAVETMQTKENMKILIITVQNMYARNDYASGYVHTNPACGRYVDGHTSSRSWHPAVYEACAVVGNVGRSYSND